MVTVVPILWRYVVFGDQAMTVAVVDRLVHHATIFEMNVESYRRRAALERKRAAAARRSMQQLRPTPNRRAATSKTEIPPCTTITPRQPCQCCDVRFPH